MVAAPLILTSVRSRVVDELANAVGRAVESEVEVRTGMEAHSWAAARAGGALSSLLIRLRGYLFPLRIDLGPRRSDRVMIATTNPFLLPAVVALRRPRARLVTLVYDLYPESLEVRFRLPQPFRALLASVTGFGLRRSAAVVFLGERTRQYVVDRYSLTCPTAVIPPGCGELIGASVLPEGLATIAEALEGKVVISYVGNMGSMHDAQTLNGAIVRTLDESHGRCMLVVSARGDRAAEFLEPLRGRDDVVVLGRLDEDELSWISARTDIALASLATRAGLVSLPSKVFTSLAGGAAILAVAPPQSDLAELVRSLSVGLVTAPGDEQRTSAALIRLVRDETLRSACTSAAERASHLFSPAALSKAWRELLAAVSHPEPPARGGQK